MGAIVKISLLSMILQHVLVLLLLTVEIKLHPSVLQVDVLRQI